MEESQFDVIVFGTGLVNSITAAALSKAGYKVAHIDSNNYYGGDEASLSLEELVQWADNIANLPSDQPSRFHRLTRSSQIPAQSRQYSICLQPAVIPSLGPLILSLVSSGVAKYSGFRLLESVSFYDSSGNVKNVPGSKEDIFKSKEISLIEKRRLMRFLAFAAGDFEDTKELEDKKDTPFLEFLPKVFSLSDEISSVIAYSLAFCMSPIEPTLPTLLRLRTYMRSGGRYGPSPFLLGHYGGIGDIVQGFCRAAAVSGGVNILSRHVRNISRTQPIEILDTKNAQHKFNYSVDLDDFPDTLYCKLIISPPSYVPATVTDDIYQLPPVLPANTTTNVAALVRYIGIIDQPLLLLPSKPTQESESIAQPTDDQGSEERSQTPASSANTAEQSTDAGIFVFPPSSVKTGSATHPAIVLINGEGSFSTPKGKWLIYITLPLASIPEESVLPENLLRPYLNALLSLSADSSKPIQPLFDMFYLETPETVFTSTVEPTVPEGLSPSVATYLVPAALPVASLPDLPDQATLIAEASFKEASKVLRKLNMVDEHDDNTIVFWPPLPTDDDDDDNEW